jgi:hypothetical protein
MNEFDILNKKIYNYDITSEYNNALINKDINNYFDELISKPNVEQQHIIVKSNYNFSKFYVDYIEHNLLFIVLLIGIVFFLVIRYFIKDFDDEKIEKIEKIKKNTEDDNIENYSDIKNSNKNNNDKKQINNDEELIKKKIKIEKLNQKQNLEKIKLINYKKKLDIEKERILSIIDELSTINDNGKIKSYQNYIGNNNHYNNNDNNSLLLSDNISNFDENFIYQDINKNIDTSNQIDDFYIEPPFHQ